MEEIVLDNTDQKKSKPIPNPNAKPYS